MLAGPGKCRSRQVDPEEAVRARNVEGIRRILRGARQSNMRSLDYFLEKRGVATVNNVAIEATHASLLCANIYCSHMYIC